MRIGEFANMFLIEQHTVRYYIRKGLLLPESKNGQYLFDYESIQDMEFILKFKDMGFSLTEIHKLISLYRISNFAGQDDRNTLLRLFKQKREELIKKETDILRQKEILKELMTAENVDEKEAAR